MTVELPRTVEEELKALAARQGRDVVRLIEDAVRGYLEAAAITDVDEADIAEVQAKLVGELRGIPDWKDGRAQAVPAGQAHLGQSEL